MSEPIQVAPGVRVFTSRTMHTTSSVLHGGGAALLVDPAWHPDELEAIAGHLDAHALAVTGGFATHAHHDHLLWHPRFGNAPRWGSQRTTQLAHSEREALVAHLGADFPSALVNLMGRIDAVDDVLPGLPSGIEVELIVHDGHAPGHTALWLPGPRVLLAGDMLSDIELPLPFYPDDVPAYRHALDLLAPFAARAAVVVPGHGTVGSDALARLDADRRYLDAVQSHGTSDDARIANPGMLEEYAHLQRLMAERSASA